MKRVVNGKTYNTDTATVVARWEYIRDGFETTATLFQTRGGAFFALHQWSTFPSSPTKTFFEEMARDEVAQLVQRTDNLEILDDQVLSEPPEAEEESEPAATIYIRVPASLKKRADTAAAGENASGNAWATRCIERCLELDDVARELSLAYQAWLTADAYEDDETAFTKSQMREMMADMAERIETVWQDLSLPRQKGKDIGQDIGLFTAGHPEANRWQPYRQE